jgi:hypothetical protein
VTTFETQFVEFLDDRWWNWERDRFEKVVTRFDIHRNLDGYFASFSVTRADKSCAATTLQICPGELEEVCIEERRTFFSQWVDGICLRTPGLNRERCFSLMEQTDMIREWLELSPMACSWADEEQ